MTQAAEVLDIFAAFATDEEAEVNGRWFPIGKGAKVLVARNGNARYIAEFKKQVEASQLDLEGGGPAADALAEDILIDVQAKTILLGWDGVGFQGAKVEYSHSMAKTMLKVKDFRRRINQLADSMENFRVRAEEQAKND